MDIWAVANSLVVGRREHYFQVQEDDVQRNTSLLLHESRREYVIGECACMDLGQAAASVLTGAMCGFLCTAATHDKFHVLAKFSGSSESCHGEKAMSKLRRSYRGEMFDMCPLEDLPMFLVAINGATIQVSAALTRFCPQLDHITGIQRLVARAIDPHGFDNTVRLLWALRHALILLGQLPVQKGVGRTGHGTGHVVPDFEAPYPCLDVVRDTLGFAADTTFRFVQRLTDQVFRVLVNGQPRVLKFARYYAPECHKRMAKLGLAPRIIRHRVLLDWHILFMEDLQQHWSLYRVIREIGVQHVHGLRNNDELQATLRPLLDAVHATGHAFGDFRPPNIMVRLRKHEDAGEVRFTAVDLKLVDFELCGAVGSPWPRWELNPEVFDMSRERERYNVEDDTVMLETMWQTYVGAQ